MRGLEASGWASMLGDWQSMVNLPGDPEVFTDQAVRTAASGLIEALGHQLGADCVRAVADQLDAEADG